MMPEKREYDAVVVGSGPNGLAGAILMQQNGLSVLLIEGKDTIGGGNALLESLHCRALPMIFVLLFIL